MRRMVAEGPQGRTRFDCCEVSAERNAFGCIYSANRMECAAQLTSDAYRQENVVSYRRRVALYAELAPLDVEINVGAGV